MANLVSREVLEVIRDEIFLMREKYEMQDECIGNAIFQVANRFFTMIQYPLEDEEQVKSVHVDRWVNGHKKRFVFINTDNSIEEQVYAVACEIGFACGICEKVQRAGINDIDIENLAYQFAAEFLMPQNVLRDRIVSYGVDLETVREKENVRDILDVSVKLMNDFVVPYQVVTRRMKELGIIKEEQKIHMELINPQKDEQFLLLAKRYICYEQKTGNKSIGDMETMLAEVEERELYSEEQIRSIRRKYNIEIK